MRGQSSELFKTQLDKIMEYMLPECHSLHQMGRKEMNIKDLFPSSAQFFSRANYVAAAKISCIREPKDSLALCSIFLKQKGKKRMILPLFIKE